MALEYRSCPWPGGLAGSPQCVRPMGCRFFPVPRPPYVCAVSRASWLLFTGVLAWFVVLCLRCPGPLGCCSPVRPLGVVCCVCGVPGLLAPAHRCARWVCCVACAASRATSLLFTGAPVRCVALRARSPAPLGSCSPVRLLCLSFCLCGVLGHLAPVRRCACVVCSRVRPLGVLCCVCGVLGPLAPVHRCARWVCCVVCAVSWATWLLFTGAPAGCVALLARCPGPPGSCTRVCLLCPLFCLCGILGRLAPVHRCVLSVRCFVCAVSWASWLLFTSAAGCGVLSLCGPRCAGVCGVVALVVPVHWCAPCVRCARAVGCCVPLSSPPILVLFFENGKKWRCAYTAGTAGAAGAAGAAVQSCCVLWHVLLVLWRRLRPRGAARVS